jgi:AraC family transcriptional regulator
MAGVLINPPAARFGASNAVLSGRAARYESRFAGPLSVKAVISGSATWETAAGRFELVPGAALLIHDDEPYEVTIAAPRPVETFCFFFERGFVEDAFRAATTSSAMLLDGTCANRAMTFAEPLQFATPLASELRRAHALWRDGDSLEESFYAAATLLAHTRRELDARASRLPALRASTREELARRVSIGTAFLHANLGRPIAVADAAREACLSPFHFARLFASFHGETPHRYLTRLRLAHARALLRSDARTVAEVAFACGFESLGSFTTLFTRTVGVTPSHFRRIEETA